MNEPALDLAAPDERRARLSKTRFLSGLQCAKRLWLELHAPDAGAPYDALTRFRLEQGRAVGELARRRWPGGTLVAESHLEHDAAEAVTRRLLSDPTVPAIYEAAFTFDGVRIRVDVLARAGDGFDLCEVKSSTGVGDVHVWDVAVQLHVLRGLAVPVRRAFLVHLNGDYTYDGGDLDLERLFTAADVTEAAAERLPAVGAALAPMRALIDAATPPRIAVGPHSGEPYDCPFFDGCAAGRPAHPIDELPRLAPRLREELIAGGALEIADLSATDERLSPLQQRVIAAVRSGEPWVSPEIGELLGALAPPIHFLDFETIQLPLPRHPGTRPWETIPVQWSDHVLDRDGRLEHREFLHRDETDPRRPFAEALLAATEGEGPVVVYSGYEARCIAALESALPDLAARLACLRARLFDILPPIREHVYHPEFHGSFSLKAMLPALVSGLDYEELEIADGGSASVGWLEMVAAETPRERAGALRAALLAYCGRDTEALVALYDHLSSRKTFSRLAAPDVRPLDR